MRNLITHELTKHICVCFVNTNLKKNKLLLIKLTFFFKNFVRLNTESRNVYTFYTLYGLTIEYDKLRKSKSLTNT
jgi:hypothetical protein